MTSNEDRANDSSRHDHNSGTRAPTDHDHDVDGGGGGSGSQTPRLVASWLVVGAPLVYGIYQTVSRTLPLFGG